MSEKFRSEGERKMASEEYLERVREILGAAKETRQIDWEENSDEFIIKFRDRLRKYSKHNPLKKAEAEREVNNLKQASGLFEVREDEDIYSITTYNRVVHVPKWEKIPVAGSKQEKETESIEEVIMVFLENPASGKKGEILKTIESKVEKGEETDKIEK